MAKINGEKLALGLAVDTLWVYLAYKQFQNNPQVKSITLLAAQLAYGMTITHDVVLPMLADNRTFRKTFPYLAD
jgi:hypothetical protein